MGNLGVDALADHLALARVNELAHFEHGSRRAKVALTKSTTTCDSMSVNHYTATKHRGLLMLTSSSSSPTAKSAASKSSSTSSSSSSIAAAAATSTAAERHCDN